MEIKEEILRLIKNDEEFRNELMNTLGINNISTTLKDIGDSIKELTARISSLTELQELLGKSIASLAEAQKRTEENIAKLTERIDQLARKTEERLNKLTERMDQLAEAQRKTEEKIAKLTDAVMDLRKGMDQLKRSIDSIGKRWGADYEELIREFFKEVLDQLGIDIKYLNRFTYKDDEGIFGFKGVLYEVDIVAKNGKVYLIEVKSFADSDDVEWFRVKIDVVSRALNLKDPVKMMLAVSATKEAIDDAQATGIKLIYGDIFEVKRRGNGENKRNEKVEQNQKT